MFSLFFFFGQNSFDESHLNSFQVEKLMAKWDKRWFIVKSCFHLRLAFRNRFG